MKRNTTYGAAIRREYMPAPDRPLGLMPVMARYRNVKPYQSHDLLIGFETLPTREGVTARLAYYLQPNTAYRIQPDHFGHASNDNMHDEVRTLIGKLETSIQTMRRHESHTSCPKIEDRPYSEPSIGGSMQDASTRMITANSYHFKRLNQQEVRAIFAEALDKVPGIIMQEPAADRRLVNHIGR